MWKVWKLLSPPITCQATVWPTLARTVGVLPAKVRPLMHWTRESNPVTWGGKECMKCTVSTSGGLAPLGLTTMAPNRPRRVFRVWFGPWSW